ncbi:PEP-CTERM sorting domain-containing protein [Rubritalea tangerina]|uniref:PEP-CTERM sorting domain-containing protein n=1 Tax=Rubritalea tangerina TaxID=430798 RepID=A0ABW4ZEQ8_9BACT
MFSPPSPKSDVTAIPELATTGLLLIGLTTATLRRRRN